jgi:hypothetical protein
MGCLDGIGNGLPTFLSQLLAIRDSLPLGSALLLPRFYAFKAIAFCC